MEEEATNQMTDAAARLAQAAEALEQAIGRLQAQQEAIEQKVERIVAAIDERIQGEESGQGSGTAAGDSARVAELEHENQELKAQAQRTMRKTLSPLVSAVLSKSGLEENNLRLDASALDRTLGALSLEQRIAVKAEMARAGMIE